MSVRKVRMVKHAELVAADERTAMISAELDATRAAVREFVRLHSRDIESSYSTYEKQGAWRAMVAMMVEAGR
jgi:diphthamide biosynthesis methyltransferase